MATHVSLTTPDLVRWCAGWSADVSRSDDPVIAPLQWSPTEADNDNASPSIPNVLINLSLAFDPSRPVPPAAP